MTKKEKISELKEKADAFNKGIYNDLASFKVGLVLILIAASIILIFILFERL